MQATQSTAITALGGGLDIIDAEIARWEAALAELDLDAPLYLPLDDHDFGVGAYRHHSIAFDLHEGRWQLIEVDGSDAEPGTVMQRPLVEAPRALRVAALERLPKLYAAAACEEQRRLSGSFAKGKPGY
jgi:hypothetical protein